MEKLYLLISWHGKNASRYIATIIPLYNEKLNFEFDLYKSFNNNHREYPMETLQLKNK